VFRRVDAALQCHQITFLGAQSRVRGIGERMENQINLVSKHWFDIVITESGLYAYMLLHCSDF